MKRHPHYPQALEVYTKLKKAGYTAFLAGGCVRDLLLGKQAQDFDFASDATPEQIKQIFPDALMVGAQFGTAVVIIDKIHFEVTTFRNDGSYSDGRRPDQVKYSKTAKEDAIRRDFTINALFYDLESEKVIDYVDGEKDLKLNLIRAVGDPERRFQEDHLRILRAVRFVAQIGFEIEEQTYKAIEKLAASVLTVSRERIQVEIKKTFSGKHFEKALKILQDTGLFKTLFPEANLEYSKWQNLSKAKTNASWSLFFAAMFLSGTKLEAIEAILRDLKLSRADSDSAHKVLNIFAFPQKFILDVGQALESLFDKANEEGFLLLKNADILNSQELKQADQIEALFQSFHGVKPAALLSGTDLINLVKGEELGRVLKQTYRAQLLRQVNSFDEALRFAKKLIG